MECRVFNLSSSHRYVQEIVDTAHRDFYLAECMIMGKGIQDEMAATAGFLQLRFPIFAIGCETQDPCYRNQTFSRLNVSVTKNFIRADLLTSFHFQVQKVQEVCKPIPVGLDE